MNPAAGAWVGWRSGKEAHRREAESCGRMGGKRQTLRRVPGSDSDMARKPAAGKKTPAAGWEESYEPRGGYLGRMAVRHGSPLQGSGVLR
jgi:hypothetical protein